MKLHDPLFVAVPFNGREQRFAIHPNRKLYTTAAMARAQVTRWKYGPHNGTGRVLLVNLDKCDVVGERPDLMAAFLDAEEHALFWGNEMRRLDDLLHGRSPALDLPL